MYENYPTAPTYGQMGQAAGQAVQTRRRDITLRQNIDGQIEQAMTHVESLKATKERMEKIGILDLRMDDLDAAVRW